jgi:outer membrane receptor for ferrienterochelin and colicin
LARTNKRRLRRALAIGLTVLFASAAPPARAAAQTPSGSLTGVIDDAQSGLPIAAAHVVVEGATRSADTDARGAFHVDALAAGIYHLRFSHVGYASAESDDVVVSSDGTTTVTLALNATSVAQSATIIGRAATRSADALQQSSTISRTLDADALSATGYNRAADALRQLPAVTNSITGDTGGLDDDAPLDIRGIGATETLTTFDGHPVAYGAQGGFNDQLSPIVGMRDVSVIYGSGGNNLDGFDAIGGVIAFRTIEPTAQTHLTFSQGIGTFDRQSTTLQATGTQGRLGYAIAAGVSGSDGPIKNATEYQPGAAWDPSATVPAVRDLGVYTADASANVRSLIGKLHYTFSPQTALTFTSISDGSWENKTGNGDTDVATYPYEVAIANSKLAAQKASDPCLAPGQKPGAAGNAFQALNIYGIPYGTGPNGQPDGGNPCQTVSSYAALNAGPAGEGPAWQAIDFDDEDLNFTTGSSSVLFQADAYTNRYLIDQDRTEALPYDPVPGEGKFNATKLSIYSTTGSTISAALSGRNDDLTIGLRYLDAADVLAKYGSGGVLSSYGSPNVNEGGLFLRDVYRVPGAPLTAYADLQLSHASATDTTYNDPRLSLVYTPVPRYVVRVAAGATTTQPAANLLGQPFTPSITGGAGGGGTAKCGAGVIDSIGSAPSTTLQPERGVDEELSVAHAFWADTSIQATVYNENVYNKIFSSLLVPLSRASFYVNPAYVSEAQSDFDSACGAGNYTLGFTENANLGLRAQGIMIDGRIRASHRVYLDYDYAVTSTILTTADPQVLQNNLTYIVGSQLPHVPLQTFTTALDDMVAPGFDARYTLHTVSSNNTKALPAYNYSEFSLSHSIGSGRLTASIFNLFNQNASSVGLENLGVPLALNSFATASAYAAYTGAAATEQFGLPPRMLYVDYTVHLF